MMPVILTQSHKHLKAFHRATLAHEMGHSHLERHWVRFLSEYGYISTIDDVINLFGDIYKAIREQQNKIAQFAIQERIECVIKALHKPILSIPQSLRPIESVAH